MTVLAVCQAALYELGQPVPTSIVSTSSPEQLRLKNIIEAQARQLRNRRTFAQQKKSFSFSLVSGQYKYPLPDDFYSPLIGTHWDDNLRLRLLGPLSDASWTDRTKGLNSSAPEVAYRIFGPDTNPYSTGGQIQVNPTPTSSGDVLSFEYISKNLFNPVNWTPSTAGITSGQYVNCNGNIYKSTGAGTTGTTAPIHTTGTASDGSISWTFVSAPYESVVVDTDFSLFDDDIMIAGVKWRYLKSRSLDYEAEYANYTTMIEQTTARLSGPFVGSFAGDGKNIKGYSVPPGGWSF